MNNRTFLFFFLHIIYKTFKFIILLYITCSYFVFGRSIKKIKPYNYTSISSTPESIILLGYKYLHFIIIYYITINDRGKKMNIGRYNDNSFFWSPEYFYPSYFLYTYIYTILILYYNIILYL